MTRVRAIVALGAITVLGVASGDSLRFGDHHGGVIG